MISGLKHKLDYDDLAHIPPDRLRYELSEGDLHVTPAPTRPSTSSSRMNDVFEPDLVVVTDRAQITKRAIGRSASTAACGQGRAGEESRRLSTWR